MPYTKWHAGFYSHNNKKIQLNSHDAAIYFHELSHAVHDTIEPLSKVSKEKAEIVAEFSAAVLCQIVGIEGQAFNSYEYVKKYCNAATPNGIVKKIMKLLSTIEKVVSTILNAAKESAEDTPQIEVTDNTPAVEEAKSEGDIAALEIEQPALDFDAVANFVAMWLPAIVEGYFEEFANALSKQFILSEELINVIMEFVTPYLDNNSAAVSNGYCL